MSTPVQCIYCERRWDSIEDGKANPCGCGPRGENRPCRHHGVTQNISEGSAKCSECGREMIFDDGSWKPTEPGIDPKKEST